MLAGIGPGGQPALDGGTAQRAGIVDHAADRGLDCNDRARHVADLVPGFSLEVELEVALGHFLGDIHQIAHRSGDGAGDQKGQDDPDQHARTGQAYQLITRRCGHRLGIGADDLGEFGLVVDEDPYGLDVGGECGPVFTVELLDRLVPFLALNQFFQLQ